MTEDIYCEECARRVYVDSMGTLRHIHSRRVACDYGRDGRITFATVDAK